MATIQQLYNNVISNITWWDRNDTEDYLGKLAEQLESRKRAEQGRLDNTIAKMIGNYRKTFYINLKKWKKK